MKAKIVLISYDPVTNKLLSEQLETIYGNIYSIVGVLYDHINSDMIMDCNLIVCTDDRMLELLSQIKNVDTPIIVTKRTLKLDNLLEVLSLKSGSKVSVISNFIKEANITIEILKQMGISHLKLIPYAHNKNIEIEETIITTGQDLVPEFSENSICVGEKIMDISTIIEIFIVMKMPVERLELITNSYNEKIFRYNSYNKNMNSILLAIFETVKGGIAFINNENRVIFCNCSFSEIVDIDHNKIVRADYNNVFRSENIVELLASRVEYNDKLVDFIGKKLLLNKKMINEDNKELGFIIGIQDVTEIQKLENMVRKDILCKGFNAKYTFDDVVGISDLIIKNVEIAKQFAKSDFTVLIQGANGTGKEIFAQAIHNESSRKKGPFVAVNLASLTDELALSELFGYEGGSFTGAVKGGKKGLFEIAHGGTLFLDEIGDASFRIQQRLLRVIQEKEIMPVGSGKIVPVDVRIIAATNKNLVEMVKDGKFREDLYYRIEVLSLSLPHLRERRIDIEYLLDYFFRKQNMDRQMDKEAMAILENYKWPGNVRELENLVNYFECISTSKIIKLEDLPEKFRPIKSEVNEEYQLIVEDLIYKNILASCITILDQFKYAHHNKICLGRNKLKKILHDKNIYTTDDQVRQKLVLLKKYGLINSGITKQGSFISEKGILFLTFFHNNEST